MYEIEQSTSLVVPFFCHDENGDGVGSLLDGGFTKRISKNGGAFGAMTVTITELENGWYYITLSTSHSDTLGILTIVFTHASCKQVNLQWRVVEKVVGNTLFDGITSVAEWLGLIAGKQTGDATARTELRATGVGSGTFDETVDSQEAVADSIFDPTTDEVDADVVKIAGVGAAASLLALTVQTAINGNAVTGTLSTTQATTNLTGYTIDQLIGRTIIWTSGDADGEATDITDYVVANGLISFTAITIAPANGDTFVIF